MRSQRRVLSAKQRSNAARQFARLARNLFLLRPGRHVALYFSYGHEADVAPLMRAARQHGCVIYLPVITDFHRNLMSFVRYDAGTRLRLNAYGILEPLHRAADVRPVRQLDVVFAPLIAFDLKGSRLGSGAGFYDRALRNLRAGRIWRRPQLIGIAYSFQRISALEARAWDVPLDLVITETSVHRIRRVTARD